ncbi:hypothetical protein BRC64_01835 [Halobacteriales archaeon QH_10_67_22]|nr:MAG: hypothetical protein BRC64_01835 [Halobacteriales archaeon QH_10_67_22]
MDLFGTHDGLSFGNATIAVCMKREGIEYLYSFDDPHHRRWTTTRSTSSASLDEPSICTISYIIAVR